MNRKKPTVISKLQERFRKMNVGRSLYMAFIMPTMLSMFSTRAFAADTKPARIVASATGTPAAATGREEANAAIRAAFGK